MAIISDFCWCTAKARNELLHKESHAGKTREACYFPWLSGYLGKKSNYFVNANLAKREYRLYLKSLISRTYNSLSSSLKSIFSAVCQCISKHLELCLIMRWCVISR